jgi:bis(5'-nucleosyl)-tetraphosphatase (symmetrical)
MTMAIYAIGDIQGCFDPLQRLLEHIKFDENKDTLWFTGDLVNRGPQSLETLRFVKNLGDQHRTVLGNHDLHLLAMAHGAHTGWRDDTLQDILKAPDRDELLTWLAQQPLLHYDVETDFILVHAGIASTWDLATAMALSHEVSRTLQSDQASEFYQNMYGNQPDQWSESLKGWDRLRCITNFFTRSRFCYMDGTLELTHKGDLDSGTDDLMPWFQVPDRVSEDLRIIFGHWAALGGVTNTGRVWALDTGCVWGFSLTAMRLEDEERFQVSCEKAP